MTPTANFATGNPGVVETGGKFAAGVNNIAGKLPLVSTSPAVIGTLSDCCQLKVNLKKKFINMLTGLLKGVQKKVKNFLIEDFFLLSTGVNDTRGAH
jgi:hypothetical protein